MSDDEKIYLSPDELCLLIRYLHPFAGARGIICGHIKFEEDYLFEKLEKHLNKLLLIKEQQK